MAAGFFYSKTFKIIATVIISVELIIIITLKVVDLYCDDPDDFADDWAEEFGGGIMMADMMMRMITGGRTTGINNTRKLWR